MVERFLFFRFNAKMMLERRGMYMAKTVRFPVKSEILKWAISNGEKTYEELASKKRLKNLPDWISEAKEPTLKQLEYFSTQTAIPFSYFMLSSPPEENIPLLSFRTINNDSPRYSRALVDTINTMEMRQSWMKSYLEEMGQDQELEFIGSINEQMDVDQVADYIRNFLDLGSLSNVSGVSNYFTEIKHRISQKGIMVMQNGVVGDSTKRKLDINEFRAFVLIDHVVPLIFLNRQDTLNAMVFSLIHEIIHVFLDSPEVLNIAENSDAGKSTERWINHVTESVLMPVGMINEMVRGLNIEERIQKVSGKCHVSKQAAVIRLFNIELASQSDVNQILEEHDDRTQHTPGRANYYTTHLSRVDISYANAVINSQNSGYISTTDASNLIGTSLGAFAVFKEKMGMGGETR